MELHDGVGLQVELLVVAFELLVVAFELLIMAFELLVAASCRL